jgi:hypothetical protein
MIWGIRALPWLRCLFAGLSLQRLRFIVDKVVLGQVFLQVLWFCRVSIIPSSSSSSSINQEQHVTLTIDSIFKNMLEKIKYPSIVVGVVVV